MFRLLTGAPLAAALFTLGACASLEPEPCTPAWVDWQKERIFDPFVAEYRSEIAALRDLRGDLDNPGMMTAFRMAGLVERLPRMAEDFNEEIVPRLQAAVATCAQPARASSLLVDMLRREGVEDDVLVWIETLGLIAERQRRS